MQQDVAEEIALKALGWIASDTEILSVFLGATGVSLEELKARATDTDFQVSVLDFLTMSDEWVVRFCDAEGLAYETPMHAKHALPGGAPINWT